jgi:hypothetical protein
MLRFVGETLELDAPLPDELRQALDYWRAKKGAAAFPARRDFRPEEMKPFLARVMLIEVRADPRDFVYKVYGTAVALPSGKDFTQHSVKELTPADFSRLIWQQYSEVVDGRRPLLHRVCVTGDGIDKCYLRLTAPLSSDGSTIDKLFAVSMEDLDFWHGIAG